MINFIAVEKIKKISYTKFRRPFKKNFQNANTHFFEREGFYLRMEIDGMGIRYGEAAPLIGFSKETIFDVEKCLNSSKLEMLLEQYHSNHLPASLQMAMDSCLLDTKEEELEGLELNAVFDLNAEFENVKNKINQNFRTLKFKISPENSVRLISLLQELYTEYGNTIKIRLDANSSFSFKRAMELVPQLKTFPIQYVEDFLQPREEHHYLELKKDVRFFLCADQSIPSPIFDVFLLKPSIRGGLKKTLQLIDKITKENKKFVLSSSFETEVGLLTLINFSLRLKKKNFAYGFDTASIFETAYLNCGSQVNSTLIMSETLNKNLQQKSWTAL